MNTYPTACLCALLLLAPGRVAQETAATPPVAPPASHEILFSSERDGDRDVYIMNTKGEILVQLTDHPGADGHADFSPDGTRILFFSDRDGDREIFGMDADGGKVTQLTQAEGKDHFPSWSPDGKRAAFTSERDGNAEIYVMDADGRNQRRLTESPEQDMAPTWSPDGALLAYTAIQSNGLRVLHVLDVGEILDNEGLPTPVTIGSGDTGYVDFSPDGKRIAFHTRRHGHAELYVMDADGENVQRLTKTATAGEWIPVWSPDGKWLATAVEPQGQWGEVFLVHVESGERRQLTTHPTPDWGPDWRPVAKSDAAR